jgi:Trk K+ transport system NAD-binding subunit
MGAYNALNSQAQGQVWGLDADQDKIAWLNDNGVQAYCGDAENIDFWENLKIEKLELILLALPKIQDIKNITLQLRHANYQGKIAAIARFDDERRKIETYGVDKVFNFYNEAGVGFAEESLAMMKN